MPSRSRLTRPLALGLLTLVALWLGSGLVVASALTERPSAPYPEPPPDGYEALRLRTADGLSLGAWVARGDERAPAVVVAHGNWASRTRLREEADVLRGLGCTVMPITLRAHGDSDGDYNDVGWSARHDVVAAVEHLRSDRPDRPVVVIGVSMGAAAALFAAPELGERAAGYVLVAPYADLSEAVRRRTSGFLPPIVDDVAFGALLAASPFVLPELSRIRPEDVHGDRPALFFVGTADDRAPPSDARRIAAHMPHARVVEMPGVGHVEALSAALHGPSLVELRAFLDEVAPR